MKSVPSIFEATQHRVSLYQAIKKCNKIKMDKNVSNLTKFLTQDDI